MKIASTNLTTDEIEEQKNIFVQEMQKLQALSQTTVNDFRGHLSPVFYRKRQVILNYGERCDHCIFLNTGMVKSTFIVDGFDRIVWFMRAGEVVVAVHSWYDQEPSEEKLIAVKDCNGFAISYHQLYRLCADHHDFALLVLRLTEQHFNFSIQRTKWMQYTPNQRLKDISRLYPNLFLEIPSTDLSRFLGISRTTLNQLRKRQKL